MKSQWINAHPSNKDLLSPYLVEMKIKQEFPRRRSPADIELFQRVVQEFGLKIGREQLARQGVFVCKATLEKYTKGIKRDRKPKFNDADIELFKSVVQEFGIIKGREQLAQRGILVGKETLSKYTQGTKRGRKHRHNFDIELFQRVVQEFGITKGREQLARQGILVSISTLYKYTKGIRRGRGRKPKFNDTDIELFKRVVQEFGLKIGREQLAQRGIEVSLATLCKYTKNNVQSRRRYKSFSEIDAMMEEGIGSKEISRMTGVPFNVVRGRRFRRYQKGTLPRKQYQPDPKYGRANDLWNDGKTIKQIATECGLGYKLLCGVIERYQKAFVGWFSRRKPRRQIYKLTSWRISRIPKI